MNETSAQLPQINTTDAMRTPRDFYNPVLNLILAASLLSKLAASKTRLKAGSPLTGARRPTTYGQLPHPNELPWYPYDTQQFYKLYTSLNANQANFPIRQHIIHIHPTPFTREDPDKVQNHNGTLGNDTVVKLSQNDTIESGNQIPTLELDSYLEDTNSTNSSKGDIIGEETIPIGSTNLNSITEELKQFLIQFFNNKFPGFANPTTEIPFTPESSSEQGMSNEMLESSEQPDMMQKLKQSILNDKMGAMFPINIFTQDKDGAESSIDLQAAEANNKRRTTMPKDYDYVFPTKEESQRDDENEDDEDDVVPDTPPPQKLPLKASKVNSNLPSRRNQSRINSKRPTPSKNKRTTPISLIYADEDYEVRTLPPRRKTNRNNPRRRTTTPAISDDYDDQRQLTKKKRRPTTTPTYDYYNEDDRVQNTKNTNKKNKLGNKAHGFNRNDEYYSQYDDYFDDIDNSEESNPPKRGNGNNGFQVRQNDDEGTTFPTTFETTFDTETTFETTLAPTTVTSAEMNTTSAEYPYYGQDHYNNISITYGPPGSGPGPHYGYGPSNGGNEHISITYAPSAAQSAPLLLDNWYNQYAKASVYQRIQDLLTPNNYYNQYDFNYNDGSL